MGKMVVYLLKYPVIVRFWAIWECDFKMIEGFLFPEGNVSKNKRSNPATQIDSRPIGNSGKKCTQKTQAAIRKFFS